VSRAALMGVIVPVQRIVTFKLDDSLLRTVDSAARKLGYDHRSELIREAIVEFLERRGFRVDRSRIERVDPRAAVFLVEA